MQIKYLINTIRLITSISKIEHLHFSFRGVEVNQIEAVSLKACQALGQAPNLQHL